MGGGASKQTEAAQEQAVAAAKAAAAEAQAAAAKAEAAAASKEGKKGKKGAKEPDPPPPKPGLKEKNKEPDPEPVSHAHEVLEASIAKIAAFVKIQLALSKLKGANTDPSAAFRTSLGQVMTAALGELDLTAYTKSATAVENEAQDEVAQILQDIDVENDLSELNLDAPKTPVSGNSDSRMQVFLNRANANRQANLDLKAAKIHKIQSFDEKPSGQRAIGQARDAIKNGQVCFEIFGTDRGRVLMEQSGILPENWTPLLTTDPWELAKAFGNRQALGRAGTPDKPLLCVSLFSRHMIMLASAVSSIGGPGALAKTVVVVHVRDEAMPRVVEEVHSHKHYGFNTHRLILVAEPALSGFNFDVPTQQFVPDSRSPLRPYDTGYDIRQCCWPRQGLVVDAHGDRHRMDGTVIDFMVGHNVKWVQTRNLVDLQLLTSNVQHLLETGLGFTISECEANASINSSVEVDVTGTRRRGDLVVRSAFEEGTIRIVRAESLLVPAGYSAQEKIMDLYNAKPPLTTMRFTFDLKALTSALKSDKGDTPSMYMIQGWVYPSYRVEDLTALDCLKTCAYHMGAKAPSAFLRTKDDVGALVRILTGQDADQGFLQYYQKYAPANKPMRGLMFSPRVRALLCVSNDSASMQAFELIQKFIRPVCDQLQIVHIGSSLHTQDLSRTHALLDSFQPKVPRLDIVRTVIQCDPDETLVDKLDEYCTTNHVDLVVLGTNKINSMGSFTTSVIKKIHCSTLISRGKQTPMTSFRHSVPVGMAVDISSQDFLKFVCKLLNPADTLHLIRAASPNESADENVQHMRLMNNIAANVNMEGLSSVPHLERGASVPETIRNVIKSHELELLTFRLGNVAALSNMAMEIIKTAPCSMLIYKESGGHGGRGRKF